MRLIDKNNDKKEDKNIVVMCIFLYLVCALIMFCLNITAELKVGFIYVTIILFLCVVMPLLGIIILRYKNEMIGLYGGFSFISYSAIFFWMFYVSIYKMALVNNFSYLILGIIGYISVIILVFNYRIKVQRGVYKDKTGVPKLSIIGILTIIGGSILRSYVNKQSENVQSLVAGFAFLIISYVFGLIFVVILEGRYVTKPIKDK